MLGRLTPTGLAVVTVVLTVAAAGLAALGAIPGEAFLAFLAGLAAPSPLITAGPPAPDDLEQQQR